MDKEGTTFGLSPEKVARLLMLGIDTEQGDGHRPKTSQPRDNSPDSERLDVAKLPMGPTQEFL